MHDIDTILMILTNMLNRKGKNRTSITKSKIVELITTTFAYFKFVFRLTYEEIYIFCSILCKFFPCFNSSSIILSGEEFNKSEIIKSNSVVLKL